MRRRWYKRWHRHLKRFTVNLWRALGILTLVVGAAVLLFGVFIAKLGVRVTGTPPKPKPTGDISNEDLANIYAELDEARSGFDTP